jgi:hypothetical protein
MNDLDFLHGSLNVHSRALVRMGADEWREFPGTSACHGFFDGAGCFDEFITLGRSGATIRMFEPERKALSLDGERTWETNWIMSLVRAG